MEKKTLPTCPVCGTTMDNNNDTDICPVCGYQYAFVKYFADENDILEWQEKTTRYKGDLTERLCKRLSGQTALCLGDRAAAVVNS